MSIKIIPYYVDSNAKLQYVFFISEGPEEITTLGGLITDRKLTFGKKIEVYHTNPMDFVFGVLLKQSYGLIKPDPKQQNCMKVYHGASDTYYFVCLNKCICDIHNLGLNYRYHYERSCMKSRRTFYKKYLVFMSEDDINVLVICPSVRIRYPPILRMFILERDAYLEGILNPKQKLSSEDPILDGFRPSMFGHIGEKKGKLTYKYEPGVFPDMNECLLRDLQAFFSHQT